MVLGFNLQKKASHFRRDREDLHKLWEEYRRGSREAREDLITAYLSLVRYVIGRMILFLPATLEEDDLFSYGILGLMDAIEGFDHTRGFHFSTYAVPRIRGGILDGLRSMDSIPPSWRNKAREISEALSFLEGKLRRPPEDDELAEYLGLSTSDLRKTLHEIRHPLLLSLEDLIIQEGKELRIVDTLADETVEDPSIKLENEELLAIIAKFIDSLPEKEALVISLYYRDGLTLKEVAEVMDLSSARISQLHSKAIYRLRGQIGQMVKTGYRLG